MKTKKLRILSALLALAMLFALMPTAAFAEGSTENNIIPYDCGENGNNSVVATLNTDTGVMTISGSGKMADYGENNQPWADQRSNIKHLVVTDGVTSIGNNAFRDCTALIDADMSKALSLSSISTSFWGCSELNKVVLNEGLTTIGGSAFTYCTSLKSIHIPSTVTEIGSWCFQHCYILEEVTFAAGIELETIEGATFFKCKKLETITIPKSVKKILKYGYNSAFSWCDDLKSVIFEPGSQLEEVASGTFSNDPTIPNDLTIYCEPSRNSILETSGVSIAKISSLNALDPVVKFEVDGATILEQHVKDNNFKAIKFKDPYKKGYIFAGWYTKNADNEYELFDFDTTITKNITLYGKRTPGGNCGDNLTWILDDNGTLTISGSGKMADYDENNQPWVGQRSNIKHLVVENGVTSIGDGAFSNCTALEEADMSKASSLKTIGEDAFANCCKLENVSLPMDGELEEIQFNAFSFYAYGDENLVPSIEKIIIPASVRKIDTYAFDGCTKLTEVIFAKGSQLNVVGDDAFRNCSDVTIYYSDETVKTALMKGGVDANKIKPANPTVTFVPNGGSDVASQMVANGTAVTKPAAPTRKGYRFKGWYEEIGENEYKLFDFSTPIKDNITLYAQWEEVPVDTYVVTVENGVAWVEAVAETKAVAAGESICVPEGATVHVKADETAFDGMAFDRWEVRKGEVKLENDRAAETTFTMPAGEVQLEAMPRLESPDDSGWDAATVVTGAVIGTGTAILAYHIGMEVYAEQVLGKDVAVPRTRGEVALLAWQLAGQPEPNAAAALLTDEAKAQQWAVESGLLQLDAEGNFHAEKKLSKLKALRVLDAAKKLV